MRSVKNGCQLIRQFFCVVLNDVLVLCFSVYGAGRKVNDMPANSGDVRLNINYE